MKLQTFLKTVLLFSGLALISCDDDDDYIYYYDNDEANGLIGNMSPSSGDLYMKADQNLINNNALNYSDLRGYYNFYSGNRTFYLQNQNEEILDSINLILNKDSYFSIFAVGNYNEINLVYYEDNISFPGYGKVNLRFINFSPDASSIRVEIDNNTIIENLNFKEASNFISIDRDNYSFKFIDNYTGKILKQSDDINFIGGHTYTIYNRGFLSPPQNSNDTFTVDYIMNL